MRRRVGVWLGVLLLWGTSSFAQTGNAQLGGIVQDPSKALIPGVSITATNVDTGVTTNQITNEAGAYNFPVLQPGTYRVSAELPGFKKVVNNDVRLTYASQTRIDFTLEVGGVQESIEVTVAQDSLMKDSSASVGDVVTQERLESLPLVGNNVLNLLSTLPGLRINPLGDTYNTIGGLGINSINTTRDGLSIVDGRIDPQNAVYAPGYGAFSPTTLVPDLVGEIRLILSPVDAELGRGNSQVQIRTRSGTNKFAGSATWSVRNTALDANTWTNNHTLINGKPTPLDWNNNNQFTVAYGGPVEIPGLYNGKNKTFFYGLYEQNIHNARDTTNVNVLTDTARMGIFRYYTGYNPVGWNPNASVLNPTFPLVNNSASWVSVDVNGNPVAPPFNPDGSPYTGRLVCFSVFGRQRLDASFNMVPFTSQDCPGGQIGLPSSGTAWDPFRLTADTTGYMKKILALTPRANYFGAGDGLNIAQYRWQRRRDGSNTTQAIIGADLFSNNKQYNIKIDHNFNSKHKVAVSYSAQRDDSADNVAQYPGSDVNGIVSRRPHLVTVNLDSTLSAHMINEARFGMNRTSNYDVLPWFNPNPDIRKKAEDFLLQGSPSSLNSAYNYLTVVGNGCCGLFTSNVLNSNGYMATAGTNVINVNPLYNYADTLSWSRGKHAFKFGAELRLPRSNGNGGINPYPTITLGNNIGASTVSPFGTVSNFANDLPGLLNAVPTGSGLIATRTSVTNLLYWLSGSVNNVSQQYWIDNFTNVKNGNWEDVSTKGTRNRNEIFKEWAAFAKDDFKVTRRLTLNLGVRWEYYGSPYIESGLTTAINDFGYGLFGASRTPSFNADPFGIFLKPGDLYLTGYGSSATNPLSCQKGVQQLPNLPVSTCDPSLLTGISFVGPKSPNPDRVAIPQDFFDIGPAVGFAYQVPWFGAGKTTIRGGYQQTFGAAGQNRGSLGGTESIIANTPGAINAPTTVASDFQSILTTRALTLADVKALVPVRPTGAPGGTLPIYGRSTIAPVVYDPNYKTPYTQNLTLSITRQVRRNVTVDLRWTGTYARKQDGTLDVNTPNIYHNPELYQALVDARAGKDPVLLDQMLAGLNLNPNVVSNGITYQAVGTVSGGVYQTGASHLRRSATFATALANGDFLSVANSLLALNPTGLQALPAGLTGVGGLRALRNGCDRLANGYSYVQQTSPTAFVTGFNASNATPLRCFPENYLIANPQFTGVTYHANLGHSNYNSLQAQVTMRPTSGTNVQATWVWAKSMQLPGTGYIDPANRNLDFARGREGAHSLRVNGTVELPIGPGKLLFRNASRWQARLLERWTTSFILNMATPSPADIGPSIFALNANNFYAFSRYQIVSDKWKIPEGHVEWNGPNNNTGTFYGNPGPYIGTPDPQCKDGSIVGLPDTMGTNLQASCNLSALALRNSDGSVGEYLLVYPQPGHVGNLGARTLNYFGQFSLDANASKTFRITESKSIQIRVDATNVLNHPNPNLPSFAPGTFGQVNGKSNDRRNLQGQLRLNF